MGVKLLSNLGGSVEINAPSTSSTYTMNVPATNATLATTDQLQNFRNKIINGGLQIWQRGTGQSTGGYGSVDRFYFGWSSGALSVVRGQDPQPAPGSVDGNYMLLGGTNLVGGYFYHGVEGVRTFAGSTCTLSYYYNNVSGTETGATPYIRQTFGIGGSGDIDTYPISDTATLVSGALFRRTLVYNLPSVAGKAIGANNHLRIIIPVSGTFQKAYWSFQFEPGSVATPFEVRPHGLELALCRRYLPAFSFGTTGVAEVIGPAWHFSATDSRCVFLFDVEARVPPTGIITSAVANFNYRGAGTAPTAISMMLSGKRGAELSATVTGATANAGTMWYVINGQILFNGCEL